MPRVLPSNEGQDGQGDGVVKNLPHAAVAMNKNDVGGGSRQLGGRNIHEVISGVVHLWEEEKEKRGRREKMKNKNGRERE